MIYTITCDECGQGEERLGNPAYGQTPGRKICYVCRREKQRIKNRENYRKTAFKIKIVK